MSARFGLRHIPPAATTFGSVIVFFNAEYAIREFGLPQRRAISKPAQAVMVIGMARITAIGIAIFTFYFRGKFEVVDAAMAILGYVGVVNGYGPYVCWKEGGLGKAAFRAGSRLAIAARRWFSITTGR
jgi:hypothetical protein